MFHFMFKMFRTLQLLNQSHNERNSPDESPQTNLLKDLKENLALLRAVLGTSYDITFREFSFGQQGQYKAALVYLKSMIDKTTINESIIKPLMYDSRLMTNQADSVLNMDIIRTTMLSVDEVNEATTIDEVVEGCLSGDTILLVHGFKQALLISTQGGKSRNVEEPKTETVVRGPREGFTESLLTNTTLLRRKIRNPNFILETMKLGKQTRTTVCIAYIKGITNPQLIEEIKRRLKRINIDAILESGYIEQFIEDAPFSVFSTIGNSEKPDAVVAKILEGRAALLIDGTPFVLTVPMLFIENFQSSDDYYSRTYFSSMTRMIRFISYMISFLAPATYVALTTFHQELIPTPLLFTMVAAEEGIPFPAVVEALTMGIIFEILREAGIRLPRPVGQAVSIVGALVLGETAVQAGIVGEPMVIVVSLTAVSSFVVPAQADSGAILRIVFVLLAGTMGGFGIMLGLLGLYIHLASLRSFGAPYLSPLAPLSPADLKDTFIRAPLWSMFTRPRSMGWIDPQRQEFRLKPHPPSEDTANSQKKK